jgi:ribosomal protein S18 acetylase RimI-like enzyme
MPVCVRDLDPNDEAELDLVVARSLRTLEETIPEWNEPGFTLPNATPAAMKGMYQADLPRADRRFLVAADDAREGANVGHLILSSKTDDAGVSFGSLFTMYVDPRARRTGVASSLLDAAESWLAGRGAVYVRLETHATNIAVTTLFARRGYERSALVDGRWPYYVITKPLVRP